MGANLETVLQTQQQQPQQPLDHQRQQEQDSDYSCGMSMAEELLAPYPGASANEKSMFSPFNGVTDNFVCGGGASKISASAGGRRPLTQLSYPGSFYGQKTISMPRPHSSQSFGEYDTSTNGFSKGLPSAPDVFVANWGFNSSTGASPQEPSL